jgi:hypothetical protein
LPSALSADAIQEALNGRCDQERLLRGIRDLAEFSDDVVASALTEWRRHHDRRPTIAGLRQLCMVRRYGLLEEAKRRAPALPEPEVRLSDEDRARRRAQVEQIMRETGFGA